MAGLIGGPIEDLDTPSLLLDWPACRRNLLKMADFYRGRPAQLRPHFKNHKCPELARLQLDAGSAVGITFAKLSEADALVACFPTDVLIANQVVGPQKMAPLLDLAEQVPCIRVAVDSMEQVRPIAQAAGPASVTIGVLVEIDIGMGRCGLPPGPPALELVKQMQGLKGVRFDGLQAYEGHLVDTPIMEERQRRTREAMKLAVETRRLIEAAGIPVRVVSGGSTSTYSITGTIEGIDEIQAGTYATMDWMYRRLTPEFELALSVLATVISRPKPDVAVLDVGLKGLGHEFGPPRPKAMIDSTDIRCSLAEEHCIVSGPVDWRVGQKIELIPSHSCTTCALYECMQVHGNGRVIDKWIIDGAGCLT
jgi:D-serine deaminase-like pyridoxal phosphate-dependent protein